MRVQTALASIAVVVASLGHGTARAQGMVRSRTESVAAIDAITPRCVHHARTVGTQVAGIHPAARPRVVAGPEGVLLFWRDVLDNLLVARLDHSLERRADDRVIAGPITEFAVAGSEGNAAAAVVQHGELGDELLFARLGSRGVARNVPRRIALTTRIDAVDLAQTAVGWAVAWSERSGGVRTTHLVFTDPRGVPRSDAVSVPPIARLQVLSLPAASVVALVSGGPQGWSLVGAYSSEGVAVSVQDWPEPMRWCGVNVAGTGVLAVSGGDDPLALWQWLPGSAPSSVQPISRLGISGTVAAGLADRSGFVAVLDEPGDAQPVIRVGSDGAAVVLAVLSGRSGALVAFGDGYLAATRAANVAPERAIELLHTTCPRTLTTP